MQKSQENSKTSMQVPVRTKFPGNAPVLTASD